MKRLLGIVLLAVILLAYGATLSFALQAQTIQQNEKGPAANELIYSALPTDQVPYAIGKSIDVYLFGLRPQQATQLPADVKLLTPPSGIVDFLLNPAPVYTKTYNGTYTAEQIAKMENVPVGAIVYVNHTNGKTYVEFGAYPGKGINPFAFRKVRFAVNYLIDRKYIIQNIYRNYAAPMYTFLSIYDPTYTIIADIVAEYQFTYNPTLAAKMISQALTAAGAKLVNGKWYYDGKPIVIKFVIRTEDERKEIGDMLANALVAVGFTVDRMYMTFGQAIRTVYFTNPADLKWQIYTEGWGKGGMDKWDSVTICQFGAPWFGWLPGLQNPAWWNYHNKTIDELTKKIFNGQFTSKQEYIWLYRNATILIIHDSVRVWVATRLELQPYASYVTGITDDLGSGLRSPFNLRTMDTPNGVVRIGHLHVWTPSSIWNDWGGFQDVYSVDIMRATTDPSDWRNPFNGEPIPFRVSWTVQTAGPKGSITVPSDAVIWDANKEKWVPVGSGVTAKSKVTFDFSKLLGSKWHDGTTITWADIVGYLALLFDIAYNPTKSSLESSISGPLKFSLQPIKGYVFHWDTGKVDVYLDYWHFDPNYIADYAIFSPSVPIELDILEFYLAFDLKTYALSSDRSEAQGIPVIDLVVPSVVQDVKKVAEELIAKGAIPSDYKSIFDVNGKVLMTDQEFVQRLKNLVNWINEHGNAWVSDGPFYLDNFNKDAQTATLKAFRDPTYPFTPSTWYFGTPVFTKILSINPRPIIVGEPYVTFVSVTGQGTLHAKYLLIDTTTNKVIYTGDAIPSGAGQFKIEIPADITKTLQPYYTYELLVIAYSDQVALPAVSSIQVTSLPATQKQLSQMQEQIGNLQTQLTNLQSQMQKQIAELRTQLAQQLGAQVSQAFNQLSASMQNFTATMQQSISKLAATLSQSLGQVNNKISALEGTISSLQASINSLKSTTESTSSDVSSLKGTVGTLQILSIIILILVIISIIVAFVKKH